MQRLKKYGASLCRVKFPTHIIMSMCAHNMCIYTCIWQIYVYALWQPCSELTIDSATNQDHTFLYLQEIAPPATSAK